MTDWVHLTTNAGKDVFLRRSSIVSFVQYRKYIDDDNWHESKIGLSNGEVHHVRQRCTDIMLQVEEGDDARDTGP